MKTVWVNRFKADGSYKPMSEWVQRECMERYTHTYPLLNDGHGFDGGGLPAHHCFISTFGKIAESGFFYEYIGNQRGDGWFYVADGDLPLLNELVYTYDGSRLKVDCMAHIGISSEPWFADDPDEIVKCWQPIQPPKYLD